MPVSRNLNPGRLDMLLAFQSQVDGTNSIGEHVKTWTTYRNIYGTVKQAGGGGENFEANQLVSKNTISVHARYDSGVVETMRFTINGGTAYYYVTDVQAWQREGYMDLMAELRDNQ